jgi:preprotein translocase subunit SecA
MNAQREVIYKRRKNALSGDRLKLDIANMLYDTCEDIIIRNKAANDFKNFEFEIISNFSVTAPTSLDSFENFTEDILINELYEFLLKYYDDKINSNAKLAFEVIRNVYERPGNKFERIVVPFSDGIKSINVVTNLKKAYESNGKKLVDDFERNISLAFIDDVWKTHLKKMDELKQSVQLAVHEQKDPLLIYKFESFELFKQMISLLNRDTLSFLIKGSLPSQNDSIHEAKKSSANQNYATKKDEILNTDQVAAKNRAIGANASNQRQQLETIVRDKPKIGRNEKVKIKHIVNGSFKTLKYKQAEPLINKGEWVIINN